MIHKPLHIILTLLFFISVPFSAAAIEDQKIAINMDQTAFEKSITELSKIFDMEITLVRTSDLPQHKFNLTLENATFRQAIKEAMRRASAQSYVLVWDQENKSVKIWILQSASDQIEETSQSNHESKPQVLTLAQMQQLEPDDDLNHSPLTAEQMQQLDQYDDDSKANKTLDKEQMQLLDQEEDNEAMTLSKEQMQRLTPDKKIDDDIKTLTNEQMSLLEPVNMQP